MQLTSQMERTNMETLNQYELTLVNYSTGSYFNTVVLACGELEAANNTADKYQMPVVAVRPVLED